MKGGVKIPALCPDGWKGYCNVYLGQVDWPLKGRTTETYSAMKKKAITNNDSYLLITHTFCAETQKLGQACFVQQVKSQQNFPTISWYVQASQQDWCDGGDKGEKGEDGMRRGREGRAGQSPFVNLTYRQLQVPWNAVRLLRHPAHVCVHGVSSHVRACSVFGSQRK